MHTNYFRMGFIVVLMALVMVPITHAQSGCGDEYVVQPGDNLTRIANICGVTLADLQAANPGAGNFIQRGQVLNIPAEVDTSAVVALSPLTAPPGAEATAIVNRFPANTSVTFSLALEDSDVTVDVLTATTDADGALSQTITVPATAEAGQRWVLVAETADGSVSAQSGVLTIVAQAPVGTTPALPATQPGTGGPVLEPGIGTVFTNTNIFLINPGGAGENNETLCNDTVVPVPTEIFRTIAPLTSTVATLISNDATALGQPGFVNSVALSDLTLESVTIDRGEAIINLSGTLNLTDVCDGVRVQAQFEQSAIQFATVDRVSVFINGVALDTLIEG